MAIYRFLDQDRIGQTLVGQVSLGPLRYYQMMEAGSGSPWIGDREDGIAVYAPNCVLEAWGGTPEAKELEE